MANTIETKANPLQKGVFFKGIECMPIYHLHENPLYNFGKFNNIEMLGAWLQNKDPSAVLMDSTFSSSFIRIDPSVSDQATFYTLNKEYEENNPVYVKSFGEILDIIKQRNHLFIVGDFISEFSSQSYSQYLDQKLKTDVVGFGAAQIAMGLIAASFSGRKITRREFLKKAGLFSLLATPLNFALMRGTEYFYDKIESESIQEGDFDNLVMRINNTFNNPEIASVVDRTGICIAKHSLARDSGFFSDLPELNNRQIQIWGASHLNSEQDIELTRRIAEDPFSTAEKIAGMEMAYLVGIGYSREEATEKVALLRWNMASLIVCDIEKHPSEQAYVISLSSIKRDRWFSDDRILGFRSSGMSVTQIKRKCLDLAYNTYYKLTDNNGKLKI